MGKKWGRKEQREVICVEKKVRGGTLQEGTTLVRDKFQHIDINKKKGLKRFKKQHNRKKGLYGPRGRRRGI